MSKYKLLRHMVDEQIRREGEFSSFMVRAGLLRDMLEALDPTEPASVDSRRMAETEGLGSAGPTSAVPATQGDAPKSLSLKGNPDGQ